MSLNLITDAWIPVRRKDGSRVTIAPWQMADDSLEFPDWPRPDLNIACLELLIGLVFLADPPEDAEDWQDRQAPDPDRLRAKLAPLAPAFNLLGDGPRFMQDRERLEETKLTKHPPGMLLIDSGGENTFKRNSDLMVKRDRYAAMSQAFAAMALFTTQIYAYSDSSKHKASMRGNGPLVTLLDPLSEGRSAGLWPLIWANVPNKSNNFDLHEVGGLPWLRKTITSGNSGRVVDWPKRNCLETFFSMPWRIRLVADESLVTGFVRKDFGTKYVNWLHPLSPYRRQEPSKPFTAQKAPPGRFFYINWLGTIAKAAKDNQGNLQLAECISQQDRRMGGRPAYVLVAGWAMNKAKPADFVFSRAPLLVFSDDKSDFLDGMITAARLLADEFRHALSRIIPENKKKNKKKNENKNENENEDENKNENKNKNENESLLNCLRDDFFTETQGVFEERITKLSAADADKKALAEQWLSDLREVALRMFDRYALPGLSERDVKRQAEIIGARRNLTAAFAGYGASGREAFEALGLTIPEQGRKKGKAA